MAASPVLNFPAELVAQCLEGPPVVVRFVDEPTDARPLSILVVQHNRDPLYVPQLPTYDLEGEAERETEMELPRFELAYFDPPALEVVEDTPVEEPILLTTHRSSSPPVAHEVRKPRPGWLNKKTWLGAAAAATVAATLTAFFASQLLSA